MTPFVVALKMELRNKSLNCHQWKRGCKVGGKKGNVLPEPREPLTSDVVGDGDEAKTDPGDARSEQIVHIALSEAHCQ